MSKKGYISRYLIIIKKLKVKPYSTFEEIKSSFNYDLDFLKDKEDKLSIGFSLRTFQRDIKEIRNLFGIEIEYSINSKGYFISNNEGENMNFQRMIEAFDLFNMLNSAKDSTPYIHFENRKPQGTENFNGLLHAIQNKLQIRFTYQKFEDDEISHRIAEPYALKEFKNRWYIMARDVKDYKIKSFSLDRLSNLAITHHPFEGIAGFNIEEAFRYSFGIISPNAEKPEDIVLSFDAIQGKYIKSLPLHETQQIILDNEEELQIQLKLFITYDFLMELLSHGDRVKVLKPKVLVDKIREMHLNSAKKYL